MRLSPLANLLTFLSPILLSGCDVFSTKTPLPGKRESILSLEEIKGSPSVQGTASILTPQGERKSTWFHSGGELSNALPPLYLSRNLTRAWSHSIGSGSDSQHRLTGNLVSDGERIVGMDARGMVTALNLKTGERLWTQNTTPEEASTDPLGGGVCLSENKVFATTSFGDILCLDKITGKVLWKQPLQTPFRASPVASGTTLYAVNIANETLALDQGTGELKWRHNGLPETTSILGGASPALIGTTLLTAYSSGEIYALDSETGQPKWVETLLPALSSDSLSSISHIRARPVVYDNVVYGISYGGKMGAFDLTTGTVLWQREEGGIRTPTIYGDFLYMVTLDGRLLCLKRKTGETVWAQLLNQTDDKKNRLSWSGPLLAGGELLLGASNGRLERRSPQDGKLISTLETGENLFLSPIIVQGQLILLTESGNIVSYK